MTKTKTKDAPLLAHEGHFEVTCHACESETIVLLAKWGSCFRSAIIAFCPRCGSRNVAVHEGGESDEARDGRPRITVTAEPAR